MTARSRPRPGPQPGSTYRSAEVIKDLLVTSTIRLLDEGVAVAHLSARSVTDRAGVDKMYVNRFFGNLDHLLLAVVEHLLSVRMRSLISSDVFVTGAVDSNVIHAFRIFVFLANNEDMQPELHLLGQLVVDVYSAQMREEFGLNADEAVREAVVGLMWMVGYLSVGHLLALPPEEVVGWMNLRREQLRRPGS